jgi:hypothetical protein
MTVFPNTVKEIGIFIKRAESLLDDLAIDLAAAESTFYFCGWFALQLTWESSRRRRGYC